MTESAAPPIGGTVSFVRALLPSLVPSEQRVAAAVVDDPEGVALLSVMDLAARTGTSAATVVRACKNLGFRGFQHLRLLLLRDLGAGAPEPSNGGEVPGDARSRLTRYFDAAAAELRESLGALDIAEFERAVEAIATARRVLVAGNGGSAPPAQMVALRFLTSGRPCEAPADAVTQQLSARTLGPADVLIAISDSGMNGVTLRVAEAAVAAGATIVGVTSYARSRLQELSSITLVAGAAFHNWGDGAPTGNLVQITFLSALHESVAERIDDRRARDAVLDEVFDIVDESDPRD